MSAPTSSRALMLRATPALITGVGLVALSIFFLVDPEKESDLVGTFVCLAGAEVALALAALVLVPVALRHDPDRARRALSIVLVVLAAGGIVLTAIAVTQTEVPYVIAALAPLAVSVLMLKDIRRVHGQIGTSVDGGASD